MSRPHSSLPEKSNALRIPVPVITQTLVPSVTGDGVDWFCFRCMWLQPPRSRCHRIVPLARYTHHRCRLGARPVSGSASATLRKIRSPQTIGVEPESAGMPSFHAMFSDCVHFTGRLVSVLIPLPEGPRHCGQFSLACSDITLHVT